LAHAFSVAHEEQAEQESILLVYQVRQPKVVAQQQFSYENHED
jgi:hypothetical protein